MGKIRIRTLGDEAEEQQKKEAKKRAEEKRIEAAKQAAAENATSEATSVAEEMKTEAASEAKAPEKKKVVKKQTKREKAHSTKYLAKAQVVDKNKSYKLAEAVKLLPELTIAKFDETVELHINTTESVSGQMNLPHGTGKKTKVAIINPGADTEAADALIKSIEAGKIDFDVLIATPDAMPRLARVARILGPRGLMPNPKNGTVTPKPEDTAKKFAGGQINFKTEAKFPILHLVVGKVSFGDEKLAENIKTALNVVDTKKIKNVTLKSTMSPGIRLDLTSL
jgi:large subunit ribosomal protein L1